ncbi:ABC transporter permease, partial [Escherichia coli]|nr:ABC transporter permease [Escherichia coli]
MRRLANTPEALVGLGILALLATMALTAPLLFPGDPLAIKGAPLLPPFQDWALPLGT